VSPMPLVFIVVFCAAFIWDEPSMGWLVIPFTLRSVYYAFRDAHAEVRAIRRDALRVDAACRAHRRRVRAAASSSAAVPVSDT
jgi:hypothetical protein